MMCIVFFFFSSRRRHTRCALVTGVQTCALPIWWDTGNGAAGPVIEKLVKLLPGEHHTIFTQVDGHFPNHHPDPTEEKNLADLKRPVADKSLAFGLAFDGDGDRIGASHGQGGAEERRDGREGVSTW